MTNHSDNSGKGIALIVIASVLWAAGYLFRKTAMYGISPLLLTFYTSLIVSIVFMAVFRYSLVKVLRAFMEHPWLYFGLSATGVAIGSTCMFLALDNLDLGITVVLEKLQPIFTMILARIFIGEHLPLRKFPWMISAITASYFVSLKEPFDLTFNSTSSVGLVAVLCAAFSWGLASVIGKKLTKVQPDAQMITVIRFFLGCIMVLPAFLYQESLGLIFKLDAYVISIVVLCAVFSTGLGYLLFYRGLKYTSATTSGFLELVTPLTGVILGMLFLKESMTPIQIMASAGLLASIYLLCKPERKAV